MRILDVRLRQDWGYNVIRPLAGTRPRGATPEQDLALEAELSGDPKERAEHVMLIDLARNDVGRIAQTGSVQVTEAFGIERYSHVMHIVSNVEGLLQPGLSSLDVLKASFPAGASASSTAKPPAVRRARHRRSVGGFRKRFHACGPTT